jgi:hypothetical protein
MSVHQVHEFLAIDRPLSAKEMQALRAVSTRAEITSTRFWNEYHWGDLKADPAKLVERCFDAYMYLANWGTHRLMLRLPTNRVDAAAVRACFAGDVASAKTSGGYLVLDLHSEDEEHDYDESDGALAALVPLRTELMRGDLRMAYLAWLLAVQAGEVPDTETEPPVPAGLSDLTAAQTAMAEFLRIDEDLISVAAEASAREDDDRPAAREWMLALVPRTKDAWLKRAIDEPDLALGGELLRAFRADAQRAHLAERRTVAAILAKVEAHRERRMRAETEREVRAQKAAAAARNKRLDAAWKKLEALVAASAYDDAIELAVDLADVAKRDGRPFAEPFEAMRKRQLRRRGFFDRWKREYDPARLPWRE